MAAERATLEAFLSVQPSDVAPIVLDVSVACREIARRIADVSPYAGAIVPSGDREADFEVRSGGTVSEAILAMPEARLTTPIGLCVGDYLVTLLAIDSLENAAVNAPAGTIFSVLRSGAGDFHQKGSAQVCAGYVIYGATTSLVVTCGDGVQAFTLDRPSGRFVEAGANLTIAGATSEISVDFSGARHWHYAVRRYVDACLAGPEGPRGRAFRFHWTGSLVAEVHRLLMQGGVLLCPDADGTSPRQISQANPLAFVIEQAGGRASTGLQRIADLQPHHRRRSTPLFLGANDEVRCVEAYCGGQRADPQPLFGSRGLFRIPG